MTNILHSRSTCKSKEKKQTRACAKYVAFHLVFYYSILQLHKLENGNM